MGRARTHRSAASSWTAADDRARGGTAVVTLEPGNHHGLTPPCRHAVLDAGIARVVIGPADPTSQAGGGAPGRAPPGWTSR
ncbi:hypothetical protein [Saccharothrix saharensis]|uniref:hypothetical protein n=1 Tax=Saccharothrix saharensis TaxID=571190 RepID=UPI001B87B77C